MARRVYWFSIRGRGRMSRIHIVDEARSGEVFLPTAAGTIATEQFVTLCGQRPHWSPIALPNRYKVTCRRCMAIRTAREE